MISVQHRLFNPESITRNAHPRSRTVENPAYTVAYSDCRAIQRPITTVPARTPPTSTIQVKNAHVDTFWVVASTPTYDITVISDPSFDNTRSKIRPTSISYSYTWYNYNLQQDSPPKSENSPYPRYAQRSSFSMCSKSSLPSSENSLSTSFGV